MLSPVKHSALCPMGGVCRNFQKGKCQWVIDFKKPKEDQKVAGVNIHVQNAGTPVQTFFYNNEI